MGPQGVVTGITEQIARVRDRVRDAAVACGRQAGEVRILAVSKGQPAERIAEARDAGLREFGESYVQEALPKIEACGDDVDWHFIGNIQSNKTRAVAEHFAWIQSVDDPRIAERLSRQRPFHAPPLQVCLQLRPRGAPGRAGVADEALAGLAEHVAGLPRLRLRGLMIVPLAGLDAAALAGEFARAARCFDGLVAAGHALDTLSMGMSADLEAAIREGSTMVRIGTALFGARS